ncbi:Piwi domain-containing protein [Microbulbifer sp. TRSA001]|uniref:Piwi domain-containing protein n=1 Tax=Microbulbifer sp. TRSA001 TaxID=3243381 RepID=UPI004039F407
MMSQNQLRSNFAEIELDSNEVELYSASYSYEFFKKCISENDSGYFFYRNSNEIYAIPEMDGLSPPSGFEKNIVTSKESPYVFTKLIDIAFNLFFESLGRRVYRKKYSSISSFDIPSEEPFSVGELKLVPKCEYSVNHIIKSSKVLFIISVSKEYKPKFEQSLCVYRDKGIDIRDWDFQGERISATRSNVKKYLERTNLQVKYDAEIERLRSKESEFNFIEKTFRFLKNNFASLNSPSIKFKSVSFLSLPNANFERVFIKKPTLYYYNKNTTRGYINVALEQLKPLSFDVFNARRVSICAFIPKSDAKQCERFIIKVRKNLADIFHLLDVDIKPYYVSNDRREHLKIISQLENKQFDLALLFLFRVDKNQRVSESAYNRLKAKLISKQIPSQSILVENARVNNEITLRNISLNLYSKLGGTPWSIEKEGIDENEFIIGVGSTINENGVRNIGFASVFDHFGSYMVGSCSPLCKIEDYRDSLQSYLSSILNEIIDSRSIAKHSKIRLVFHLFKDASKKYELSAINQCLEEFSEYEIEYAIVNISYNHSFKMFNNVTEQLVRGCFVKMSDSHALLCMGGKGSRPLQIKLDARSTYKDLFELSKQILFFAHLSHRSFMPANSPVTTIYPQRLAKLTSDLLTVNHWDVDMLHGMKEKLWFI